MNDWSLEAQIIVKMDGEAKSVTSHEIFDLDNSAADIGGEAILLKLIEQIHEWQEVKKGGAANFGENPNGLIKSR